MSARTDLNALRRYFDTLFHEAISLFKKCFRVNDHAVAEHARLALVHNTGRQQVKHERPLTDLHRMPGVVSTLITSDDLKSLGKEINDLPFAFITPLGSDHRDDFWHDVSSQWSVVSSQLSVVSSQ